jgi:hypothetical protein
MPILTLAGSLLALSRLLSRDLPGLTLPTTWRRLLVVALALLGGTLISHYGGDASPWASALLAGGATAGLSLGGDAAVGRATRAPSGGAS